MGQFIGVMQKKVKSSSQGALLFAIKLASGMILGLTLALIGEEMIGYGTVGFMFVIVVFTLMFMHKARRWGYGATLIFDLVCVLIGLLLRMYILIAPGA